MKRHGPADQLDGNYAVKARIVGAIHLSHPTAADRGDDLVRAHAGATGDGHACRNYNFDGKQHGFRSESTVIPSEHPGLSSRAERRSRACEGHCRLDLLPMPSNLSALRLMFKDVHARSRKLLRSHIAAGDGKLREIMDISIRDQPTSDYPFVFRYAFCR